MGHSIRVRGPKGAFTYTPNMVRHFGMIAGGTGITPMLQVVKAIVRGRAAGDRTEVDLIFANVTDKDILLREDLDALAQEDKGFRVHYVLDKPPEGWTGGVGYVTADMVSVSTCCVCARRRISGTRTNGAYRNGCPSLPATSRSCSAVLLPWSAVSRRPPSLLASRRHVPSASLRTRSLLSKHPKPWTRLDQVLGYSGHRLRQHVSGEKSLSACHFGRLQIPAYLGLFGDLTRDSEGRPGISDLARFQRAGLGAGAFAFQRYAANRCWLQVIYRRTRRGHPM